MDRREIDDECDRLVCAGGDGEEPRAIISRLRTAGRSTVEAIYMVSKIYDLSLSAAKEMVVLSPEWIGDLRSHVAFHDDLEGRSKD